VEDGSRAEQEASRLGTEGDEDVHIEGGDGFEIEGRADRAADGVALNDAVGLHLIDGGDDFPNVHVGLTLVFRTHARFSPPAFLAGLVALESSASICAMLGRALWSFFGRARVSWYSETPMAFLMPRRA